jgi:hypothetical protein
MSRAMSAGELPLPAAGAPVVGAEHVGRTQHREDRFAALILVAGLTAACARHRGRNWSSLLEKFAQTRCAGGVQRSSKRQLHGLHVQVASLASFGEDAWQQGV